MKDRRILPERRSQAGDRVQLVLRIELEAARNQRVKDFSGRCRPLIRGMPELQIFSGRCCLNLAVEVIRTDTGFFRAARSVALVPCAALILIQAQDAPAVVLYA